MYAGLASAGAEVTGARIIAGECMDEMAVLEADSVDAVVTDPPYGLKFMGKEWDRTVPSALLWGHVRRVAKPGAYMLCFAGPRTQHRMGCAIEDAGWEVQDCLMWLFGSGFPKHKSKLKPAYEPIILARKPASRATLLRIDDCRIGTEPTYRDPRPTEIPNFCHSDDAWQPHNVPRGSKLGRWPATVVLDEEAAAQLDEQSGISAGKRSTLTSKPRVCWSGAGLPAHTGVYGFDDKGGASRFFYVAKASRAERDAGCEEMIPTAGGSNAAGFTEDVAAGRDRNRPVLNHHPTVKPIALMRWLCRLVTPAGGVILDPFAGSGSTGCAAVQEGFQFIGIEREQAYAVIANARISHWATKAVA